ncbi:YbaK/EbsC family protein [Rhodopila sp.]|uniref:YbaK/EbsC family protein n=1 Tax=Rhodopila sp. TaxID=2480087 RepID=UPI003D0D1FB4
MRSATSEGTRRVQAILGNTFHVLEFEQSTHSSAGAAAAVGCDLARIAKSMLFRTADGQPVLVVASGANRVDEKKVTALVGRKIVRADLDFVQRHTGFTVGGVPPIGHVTVPVTFLDQDLERYTTIWAAAGSPNAVFELSPADLARLTAAAFTAVAK